MKTVTRVLWAVAGVILILAGVFCLSNLGVAIASLSLWLGISMLIAGIVDLVVFGLGHNVMYGSGWFLLDGILTILLSLFILFHQAFAALSLPFIFGMWLLFSGIAKFVNSFDLRRWGVRGWGWFTALGILLALAGFLSFLDPVAGLFAIGILVGISLILQGVGTLLRAIFSQRFLM